MRPWPFTEKAIKVVLLQSEGKIPVDTASIKQLHFECTFHSRFTIVQRRPLTYGITFPGTFRQAVCSTTYPADGKIGVVQYCHFREVPSEVDKMLSLFNVRIFVIWRGLCINFWHSNIYRIYQLHPFLLWKSRHGATLGLALSTHLA